MVFAILSKDIILKELPSYPFSRFFPVSSCCMEVLYNPSYEVMFNEETKPGLEGFDVGQETELGAINVMTGVFTGRSPKDKFIVMDENSRDTVWWYLLPFVPQ